MADFLLEILSEEIPASMQRGALERLGDLLEQRLADEDLKASSRRAHVSPRRMVVHLEGLPERQPSFETERKGPRIGAPARAVAGFARSAGVETGDLVQKTTAKGDFWFAVTRKGGKATAEVLARVVPEAMTALVWPKSMRWADGETRWVRPVVSILALFAGDVVPFRFAGCESGAVTRGHRFLHPAPFEVRSYADYRARLRDACVVPDHDERRSLIEEGARAAANDLGLVADAPARLVEELAGLVEWPVVMAGAFDDGYMEVPDDLLTTEMVHHQRYIPLRTPSGNLAPGFLFVANMEGRDGGLSIRKGNERVLAARLADGRHFWERDLRVSLESRTSGLSTVVFHARLGTLEERAHRLKALASWLAPAIPGCDRDRAGRAAWLAKADLVSDTVGEFPELQGIMGGHLARAAGEDADIALAITEHYRPAGPSDRCPSAPVSVAVAMAERLDTLAGFFGIGERPSGSRDPLALRRAALGTVRLVLENGLRLDLLEALKAAGEGYGRDVSGEVLEFVADRLRVHLRERRLGHHLIDAAFSGTRDGDLVRLVRRIEALDSFIASPDGGDLLEAYRRAANILRIEEAKDGCTFTGGISRKLLLEEAERTVATALETADAAMADALAAEDFAGAMEVLASLRPPLGAFFDSVTVNADDPALRENRLNLLGHVRQSMDRVADFSRIGG